MLKPATIPAKIYYILAIKYLIINSLLLKLSAGLRHQISFKNYLRLFAKVIFRVYTQ